MLQNIPLAVVAGVGGGLESEAAIDTFEDGALGARVAFGVAISADLTAAGLTFELETGASENPETR